MVSSTNGIIHRVRHLLGRGDATPDSELLTRFVADRDGEAFTLLVHRHGPMVLGVCRRVLRNAADADDAFQATFLVLARRAGAVRPQSLVGNWLYGVAYRTALEAKRAAAVRRARERRAAEMKTPMPAADAQPDDLRELLDRELSALPDVYRAAVVLCDLQGLSRKDAAERLGWAEGTLSGRLFRARSLLAERLSRHGLVIPAAGIGVITSTASAGVPAALAESTARIGVLVAAGELAAVAAAPVAALTEGVMKAMLLTKLKSMATAVVVGCAVLATSVAGWQANATGAAVAVADGQATRKTVRDPDKDRIAELERERDELLKMVRDLKDRLAKLEDNQDDKLKRRAEANDRAALEAYLTELNKLKGNLKGPKPDEVVERLKELNDERAKPTAGQKPKVVDGGPPAELLEKLRKLEMDLAKGGGKAKDAASDLAEKLKALELEAAKAAKMRGQDDRDMVAKVKGAKEAAGDRVAALEERMKAMERNIERLLSELERQRKK